MTEGLWGYFDRALARQEFFSFVLFFSASTTKARSQSRGRIQSDRMSPFPPVDTVDELPKYLAVLSGGSTPLAQVAQPAHSWKRDDLGEICSHPTETPRLRGESRRSHGGPIRAQSWKRRTEPRNTYNPSCFPLLGGAR
jgi:hypothetical protein